MASSGAPSLPRSNTNNDGLPYTARRGMQSPLAITTSLLYSAYLPACSRPSDARQSGCGCSTGTLQRTAEGQTGQQQMAGRSIGSPRGSCGPEKAEQQTVASAYVPALTIGGTFLHRRHSTPPGYYSALTEYQVADGVTTSRGAFSAEPSRLPSISQEQPRCSGDKSRLLREQSSTVGSPPRRASSSTSTSPSLLFGEHLVCRRSKAGAKLPQDTVVTKGCQDTKGNICSAEGVAPVAETPVTSANSLAEGKRDGSSDNKSSTFWPWKLLKKTVRQNDQITMVAP